MDSRHHQHHPQASAACLEALARQLPRLAPLPAFLPDDPLEVSWDDVDDAFADLDITEGDFDEVAVLA